MIRVIGGKYKRLRITQPESHLVRPTQDRVREALFSALGDIEGRRALDLFAGSGAYGFEAISRGCKSVVFVDALKLSVDSIKDTIKRIKPTESVEVYFANYKKALDKLRGRQFDIVFLDPPYNMDVNKDIVNYLVTNKMLSDNAIVVLEQELELEEIEGFVSKMYKYSYKRVGIYRRISQ